ncbi:MAG: RagB/SusD family nutrient uptake outer membrane protein [Bacteroidales bacterium]|nr:RagB/SusD family nutrient uptake outer membrane protein [Bacteroidales bacterium]MBP3662255.1 RagB/SusD family nutrient uptake outer membrane protein [Bacteroidales bacterium]
MKTHIYISIAAALLIAASCDKMNQLEPQGGNSLTSQVLQTNQTVPSRINASFNGMFTKLGAPDSVFGSGRPDDWGFLMIGFSGDIEAADVVLVNSGYNWFSTCGALTSRNADYANPYVRYAAPYNEIAAANEVIRSYPEGTTDQAAIYNIAQAHAIRAFAYLNLAPYFQFGYAAGGRDLPCVPIVTEDTENFTDNPRASVEEVYQLIISDLTYAIENLEGYVRPNKSRIDVQVAYALRARAYLNMQEWALAAADAEKALEGYSPATMTEVSKPFLYDINEHNWIWGYDMQTDVAMENPYATSSAWLRSFSGDGYSAGTQVYSCCNSLLYDRIPDTDVRKGWWVNSELESPLLAGVTWDGVSGNAVGPLEIDNVKTPFLPYTNVKFGMFTVGGTSNDEDWPFIRAEEMILVRAEGLVKSGQTQEGKAVLEDFVRTYRDPSYSADAGGRTLEDEIWFQRRVELWGEGFSNPDTRRLNKPLVRFHGGTASNVPAAFRFNMPADDGWWLMRFTSSEKNTNLAIIDNTGGTQPVQDQYPDLRDGATD